MNNWEQEMWTKLYEQKQEDERTQKITKILEYVAMAVLALAIVLIFMMNRSNGYMF